MKVKTINFERKEGVALYLQIYQKLQSDILSGYLKQHDQLPSIRKCEKLFKVSKTSIERAFQQLLDEGYIISIPQKGYFVDVDMEHVNLRNRLIEKPTVIKQEFIRYDFRSASMDSDSFDITLWKKYLKEVLDSHSEISTYGDPQGERSLRQALQQYAYSIRGVLCDSEQMLIGSSFQSLLYVLCGMIGKHCIVAMEESGFVQAEKVFHDYGWTVRKLPMSKDGISLDALRQSDAEVLYLNSVSQGLNHQPVHKKQRSELLQWAREKNAYIIEDDHNGELRYHSRVTPAMQGFDMGRHVIYIGSFSKLLLPSLRISYMVFTKNLAEQFHQSMHCYSPTSSKIEQLALAHYICDGHLERHVKRLRKRYDQKSTHMMHVLQNEFPKAIFILEEASLQIIMRLSTGHDIDLMIHVAMKEGIVIQKSSMQELVLSFAAMKEEDMYDAIHELHELWKKEALID